MNNAAIAKLLRELASRLDEGLPQPLSITFMSGTDPAVKLQLLETAEVDEWARAYGAQPADVPEYVACPVVTSGRPWIKYEALLTVADTRVSVWTARDATADEQRAATQKRRGRGNAG